jgi:hypothetical protein
MIILKKEEVSAMYVFVLSKSGIPLMPTTAYRARRLLKNKKAVIEKYDPFTIRLTERENGNTQPVEYKCDTGYQHIGISICSGKHEYVNEQRDLLPDEVEKHKDRLRYRRARRSRLRYRKPRFENRKKRPGTCDQWFAPSLDNKLDQHIKLYQRYQDVLPIKEAVFEMGNFDTQLLKAIEKGAPIPQGADYQHGERYGISTLREAVFSRDDYKCILCGKGLKEKAVLHVHHLGYWKEDRSDRLDNLATVCHKCHTSKNHKPGGKLYGLAPKLRPFKDATFMTMVRWAILDLAKKADPSVRVSVTYGAMTKLKRKELGLKKTHSNDAYAMGDLHPKHRTDFHCFKKRRKNNRVLEKFYDAVYTDIRDGTRKKGSQIGCNRTNRREARMSDKNERVFHGQKVKKGRRSIRKARYTIQPGTLLLYDGDPIRAKGVHCNGSRVMLENGKSVAIRNITIKRHPGRWEQII